MKALPRTISKLTFLRLGVASAIIFSSDLPVFGQNGYDTSSRQTYDPYSTEPAAPRPSFLPPPEPVQPSLDRYSATPPPSPSGDQRTMVTQLELPVPEPVSEASQMPSSSSLPNQPRPLVSEPSLDSQYQSYSQDVPDPSLTSEGQRRPGIVYGNNEPVPLQSPQLMEQPVPVPSQNATPPTSNSGMPSVVYEGLQTPAPAPVPAPTPPPVPVAQPPPPLDPGQLLREKRYAELVPMVEDSQDPSLGTALGWSYYNDSNYFEAEKWFQQSILWNESNYEAAYGLGLTLLRQNKLNEAEQIARWRLNEYPKMQALLGDITTARAVAAYKAENYSRSRELFEEVERYRPLTRDEKIVQAWNYFHSGLTSQAASEFEKLYSEKADKFAANGVFAVYARQRNWTRLGELAEQNGGTLAELYSGYIADKYYSSKLYANAHKASPSKYPQLKSYTSPEVRLDASFRHKTGNNSLSQLDETRYELGGSMWQYDVHQIGFLFGLTELNSDGDPIRILDDLPDDPELHTPLITRADYNSLFDFRFFYQREGFFTPRLEVGATPSGGAVSPTIVGQIGLRNNNDWGEWQVQFYRESVKESVLSYVGWEDPYSGLPRGRVTESGLRLSGLLALQNDWSVYGLFSAGTLSGVDVVSNTHTKINIALNKVFKKANFSYITVGPSFSFEHYAKNLSFFTTGHGGYFSPEYLIQGTVGARFMTLEGKPWLVKGSFDVGLQSYEEAAAALYPLSESANYYTATKDDTIIALAKLSGLFMMTPHWAFGADLSYNRTANYSEFYTGAYLKFFFEPRLGLYNQDFTRF